MSGKQKKKAGELKPADAGDDQKAKDVAGEAAIPEVIVEPPAEEPSPDEACRTAELELEVATQRDRLARLQADFENYKRRVIREKTETYRRANEDIMEELLPVLDHLDLAFGNAVDEDLANPVVQGLKLVGDQLRSALGKFGLEAFDATGELFNPNEHEAISHLPSAEVAENHVVIQARGGYRLGSYLLRPAQVVVSSGVPAAATDDEA